jgi:hypothetical protein
VDTAIESDLQKNATNSIPSQCEFVEKENFWQTSVSLQSKEDHVMPPIRIAGSLRMASIRNSYLRSRALTARGVNEEHWLAIFWWVALELHVVLLKVNGSLIAKEHYIISVNSGTG